MKETVLIHNNKYFLIVNKHYNNGNYQLNVAEIKRVFFKYFQHDEILCSLFNLIIFKIICILIGLPLSFITFCIITLFVILWKGYKNYKNYNFINFNNFKENIKGNVDINVLS